MCWEVIALNDVNSKSILSIKDVDKFYGKFQALNKINLKVEEGELVAILGESGSGKSTLLNVISGLDTLSAGEITINGISTRDFTQKEWSIYRNHYVGFIFQEYNLIDHLTVVENVELPLLLQGEKAGVAREKALEKCKMLGLTSHIHKLPKKISGGQQQRVAIARALVTEPKVILADEPTGALDSENAKIILDILKVLSEDHIVLLVTHDEEYAKEYASRIVTLEDGKIISDTNQKELGYEHTEKLNLKRPNMKLKVLWKFARNNLKTRLSRTFFTALTMSLGLIAIFLIIFLINGIRTEVTNIINDIVPEDQYYIESLIRGANVPDSEYEYITNHDLVNDAYFEYSIKALTNNPIVWDENENIVAYEEAFFNISSLPLAKKNYLLRNNIIGEYPKNDNEAIISSSLARNLLGFSIKESDLKRALKDIEERDIKLHVQRVSNGASLDEYFDIVGIIVKNNTTAYIHHTKVDEYYDLLTEKDIETYYGYKENDKSRLNVYLKTDDKNKINQFEEDLLDRDLVLTNPTQMIYEGINDFFDTVLYILLSTAGVSLLVSGILVGLMIYISVLERIKEIGILTSIGARRSNIRHLFIFESGFLGFLSSFIALMFALLISWIINSAYRNTIGAMFGLLNIEPLVKLKLLHIDLLSIVVVFGISIIYAIICGLIPAYLASRLKAVEALRKE